MLLRAAAVLCALLHLAAAHDDQQATTLQSLRAIATNFDTATAAAPGRPWDPSAAGPCPPPGAANNDTWKGVTCDADGIVVSLSLAGLGLQGPLPPALAQLGTLRLLNLSGNAFTGSLPAAWLAPDAFANLTSADLHSNRLGAVLPDGLLSLASEVILLGSNLLNGSLPGNWQSSTLRVLGLGNNSLTGQLPSGWAMQGRLPALRELSLQANQLQGSVPAQYWTDGSFLPGLALAAEPGNPAVCGPVPPLSPELLGSNVTQLTAANVMYTGNTTTTLTVSAKGLFRPGASVTVTNWLGSCTQPCTAETLPAAVRQQGASWPPSIATNIYDLSRNYSISIADILLSNPGAAAARPDGAPLQLPCYAPLSAGAQGNYRGGNVAFGMFAGGNQAEGPEGLPGAAAAGRVVGTLPNQYNTSSFYTGSLGPASNGTAGVSQLLEPVWWFVDLLVPFQVSTVVVTAGDGQELRNASLYIGSSPSSVFDNTLVAERFSVAAGKQLALAASGTAGRYVVLYTGTQQEGSMSLADVQVYTAETNAAAAKNVSLRHISTSTYQDVAPQGTPAQDLLALTDNNGTTCVSLPLSPNSSWLAAALVDLGYQAPVGSVALAVGSQLPPGTTARFFVTANRGDRLQPGSPGECASEALALGSPGGWQAQECNQTGRWVAVTLSTPPSNSSDQAATVQLCEVQVSLTQSPSSEVPGSTSDSNSSSGLSAGAIAGIAVGAAAGLCLLLLLAAYLRWRHRFRGQVPEQQQEAEAAAAKGDVEMSIGDGKAFSSHSPGGGRGGGASAAVLASDAMGDAAGSSINGGSGRLSEGMAAAAAAATSAARLAGRGQSAARHELQLMDEFVRQLVGRSTSTPLPSPAHSSGSGVPPTAAHPDEQLLGSGGRKGTDLSKLPPGFFDVKFDELQLQQQLGEGSFGKVFLATYCGTLVAVKLIEQPSGTDASGTVLPSNTVRELAKEALLMSKLRHPNVCLYLGACLEPPCLVLEYCAKKSLFALLTAGRSDPRVAKQLGWGRLLGMALDAATGMLYLHTRNPPLAHRDLKSANLLVDSHWRAKVADFNLSGAARDIGAASCSTILMNNPRWMPPEVLGGGEQGHLSADVWAFGTVLWEVMTWRLPFEGMNVFSIIALVQSKGADALAVPPPDELPAGRCACFAEYTALMRDCWAHDPSHRPGFASIVDRLRAMAASQAASGPEQPKPVAAAALAPAAVPTGPPAAAPQAWRAVSVAPPSPSDAASPYDGFVAMMRHPEQQTPFAAAQVDAQLDIMERQPGTVGTPASQPSAT